MAYCRFGRDSDVYVYDVEDGVECCWCRLRKGRQWLRARTHEAMIHHLLVHRTAGHKVPEEALEELRGG
ncbi:MAG TPA: hypothetical protein VHG93_25295 [Longimicrobium sp.]|nr:hypothetical protein [Longimicrobium sp.]